MSHLFVLIAALVDFTTPGMTYCVSAAKYLPEFATEQISVSSDGLVVRFDSTKIRRPSRWMTFSVPPALGARDDWFGRRFKLVLSYAPTGVLQGNLSLNFTDAHGETFQFKSHGGSFDGEGNYVIDFDLTGTHGKGWGGEPDGVIDRPLRLTAVNVYNSTAGDAEHPARGELSLLRIDECGLKTYPRATVSREAISTDTTFPGAPPFPGAKRLAFKIEPAFDGKATLTLSHDSSGADYEGKRVSFTSAVSNGVVRFATGLDYSKKYEFFKLAYSPSDGTKGPFSILRAVGEFVQSAAEAMRLTAETGNPLHIMRDGRNERPCILVGNPSTAAIRWKTEFVLSDYFGREMRIPFDRLVAAKETVRVDIPTPLPAKGVWRVRAEVTADDGSKAVKESRFAYVDLHEVTPKVEKPKFRFGINYHGARYWPGQVDLTLAALVASGAKFARCDNAHVWSHVERSPGVFDWEKSDAMIDRLVRAGFALDVIVAFSPNWARDPEKALLTDRMKADGYKVCNCDYLPREGLFGNYCEKFARRYGQKIDYYECGNEWDLHGSPVTDFADLLRIQREAYEGIHAGYAGACVIPNGWAGPTTPPNADPKTRTVGLVEYFADHPEFYDAWAFHCHGDFAAFRLNLDERFLPMREGKALRSRPWLLNECALTTHGGRENFVARHVWMKMLFGWSRGSRDHIWYNLRATGWAEGSEPGYGLMTADMRPRAGYAAFAAVTSVFQGLDFDRVLYTSRYRHLLLFRGKSARADGLTVAGWNCESGARVRAIRIRTDAGSAKTVDLMGNVRGTPVENGVVTFMLSQDPQALALDGATFAEIVNRGTLDEDEPNEVVLGAGRADGEPTFVLVGADCVKNDYEANPAFVHRLWEGNHDLSAKVWLKPSRGGLDFRVVAVDDVAAAGDRLEFDVIVGGETKTYRYMTGRRKGRKTVYDGTLPVTARSFRFNCRLVDDDGEGVDGCMSLRSEGHAPVEITVSEDGSIRP